MTSAVDALLGQHQRRRGRVAAVGLTLSLAVAALLSIASPASRENDPPSRPSAPRVQRSERDDSAWSAWASRHEHGRELLQAGSTVAAREVLQGVVAQAKRAGWPRGTAQAEYHLAVASSASGRLLDALLHYESAALAATELGLDALAVQSWARSSSDALLLGDPVDAARRLRFAESRAVAARDLPSDVRARLEFARAKLAHAESRDTDALFALQEARDLARDARLRAVIGATQAVIALRAGRIEQARDVARAELETLERDFPDAPERLGLLDVLTRANSTLGDHEAAMMSADLLIEGLEATEQAGSLFHAISVHVRGVSARQAGHRIVARRDLTRAIELYEGAMGPNYPHLATPWQGLAALDLEEGNAELALRRLERARLLAVDAHNPRLIATIETTTCEALRDLDRRADAAEACRRALELLGDAEDPLRSEVLAILSTL